MESPFDRPHVCAGYPGCQCGRTLADSDDPPLRETSFWFDVAVGAAIAVIIVAFLVAFVALMLEPGGCA
jgi:hypothetical protein